MRALKILLLLTLFLSSQASFSQEFQVPNIELSAKEDYAKVEKDVIAAAKWLVSVPLNEQAVLRKEVSAFVLKWVMGSPTVNVDLYPIIMDLEKKNPGMMPIYFASCAKYALENNYSKDKHAGQAAGLRDMIAYYKAGNGTVKDKKMDKLVKADEEGKLDEWINKNMGK